MTVAVAFLTTDTPSLSRHYPASQVLRTSPSPQTARPVPRGRPVEGHAPSPHGLPVLRSISVYRHAVVNTPVARWILIARGTAYSNRFPVSSGGGLPQTGAGSATTLDVSRPAQRSLAITACAARCIAYSDTSVSKAPTVSFPPPPLRSRSAGPAGATQLPGEDLHPTEDQHLHTGSRRTLFPSRRCWPIRSSSTFIHSLRQRDDCMRPACGDALQRPQGPRAAADLTDGDCPGYHVRTSSPSLCWGTFGGILAGRLPRRVLGSSSAAAGSRLQHRSPAKVRISGN